MVIGAVSGCGGFLPFLECRLMESDRPPLLTHTTMICLDVRLKRSDSAGLPSVQVRGVKESLGERWGSCPFVSRT